MSSSSSDSEVKVKKIKKEDKPTTKKEKKVEDIQSSEDEEKDLKILNKKTKRDKKEKKEKKEKKKDSDDESDSDSVEVIAKNTKKKIESDSDSDSEQMKPQKKVKKEEKKSEKKPEKKPQKKIESESEDEDEKSNSEEKPKKGQKKSEKKPVIKNGMSDSDEESDSEPKQKSKPKKEKEEKKEQKKEEEESQEENGAKATAKKEEESEEEKENDNNKKENEEELPENVYEELFVRNIGYNTTEEELADYFGKYGDVEVVKIVTDKNTGKSRGFGFLKFYEKKSAFEAMKDADNIIVGERNLQIRYSNDKGSQMKGGNGGNNSAKKGPSTEFGIFVGNISYKCTENDLKKFFKDCGKVVDVRIAKKPDGKLKGFAHVDFETKEGMEKAVEKNGKELQGRALKIDQSTSGGNKKGGNFGNKGQGRGNRRDNNSDPMAKAKKTGGIIAPTENKVTTYDDSDDE